MTDNLFTVGATVFDNDGKEWKIAKIHKTGNFEIAGLPSRQFRPYRDNSAFETGGAWAKMSMYADTPERRLKNAKNTIKIEIERLRILYSIADRVPDAAEKEALRIQEVNATFGR